MIPSQQDSRTASTSFRLAGPISQFATPTTTTTTTSSTTTTTQQPAIAAAANNNNLQTESSFASIAYSSESPQQQTIATTTSQLDRNATTTTTTTDKAIPINDITLTTQNPINHTMTTLASQDQQNNHRLMSNQDRDSQERDTDTNNDIGGNDGNGDFDPIPADYATHFSMVDREKQHHLHSNHNYKQTSQAKS